jgi:hypothetical protein
MSAALRWALALIWGCAWSLPWLLYSAAPCFLLGWLPAWWLAGAVLMRRNRLEPESP